jgi:uncharacterized repeat protein (TIGR03803 family)
MRLIAIAGFAALMLVASSMAANASNYRRLYSFKGGSDGSYPIADLADVAGTLYGITSGGGGAPTIFAMDPKTGAKRILYTFTGGSDGAGPESSLIAVDGLLYGTTTEGGLIKGGMSLGTVFSLDLATGAYSVLHRFAGSPDGAHPVAGLIKVGKDLYGVTQEGGSDPGCAQFGCGTIFSIDRKTHAVRILHSFSTDEGGTDPVAALIRAGHRLYGTAQMADFGIEGGVFSLNPATSKEKTVYQFDGTGGAVQPFGGLIDIGGILYGTSVLGGGYDCDNGARGCGTIYAVDPKTRTAKTAYVFQSFSDGAWPRSSLTAAGGLLYGTTSFGGACADNPLAGCGTVFAFDPATGVKTTIYAFRGGKDGAMPWAGLINVDGVLYGVTEEGGAAGVGTVFAITP